VSESTWPEQDAVFDWLEKHDIDVDNRAAIELARAVTEQRLANQHEIYRLRQRLAKEHEPVGHDFGYGDKVVHCGTVGKRRRPAVFVRPAKSPGVVGESAEEKEGPERNELYPCEWYMTFPTHAQAEAVAEALMNRLPAPQPAAQAVPERSLLEFAAQLVHMGREGYQVDNSDVLQLAAEHGLPASPAAEQEAE